MRLHRPEPWSQPAWRCPESGKNPEKATGQHKTKVQSPKCFGFLRKMAKGPAGRSSCRLCVFYVSNSRLSESGRCVPSASLKLDGCPANTPPHRQEECTARLINIIVKNDRVGHLLPSKRKEGRQRPISRNRTPRPVKQGDLQDASRLSQELANINSEILLQCG